MKKLLNKRVFAVVMALAMVFAMTCVSFADTVQVNLYVQEADRMGATPVSTVLTQNPIVVNVESGQSAKDAIDAAVADNNNLLSAVEWKGDFLKAATYNGSLYENIDSYYVDETTNENVYEGLSWMYFNGTPADMPMSSYDYPTDTLGGKILTEDTSFTLSYEALEYRW